MSRSPIRITPSAALFAAVYSILAFLPCAVLGFLVRQVVRILVWIRYYGFDADLVEGGDCVTVAKPMRSPDGLLTVLLEVDARVELDEVKTRFQRNLLDLKKPDGTWRHPKLRSSFLWFLGFKIAVVHHPHPQRRRSRDDNENVEPSMKLEEHFTYVCDKSGDPLVCDSDDQMTSAIETFANDEVFPGKPLLPPWKFHIFYKRVTSGPSSDDDPGQIRTLVVLHVDHVILDGGALVMTVLPALLDDNEDAPQHGFESSTSTLFGNLKPVTPTERALLRIRGFLIFPLTLARILHSCHMWRDRNPLRERILHGRPLGRYFLEPKKIPVSHLLAIRKSTGARVNTIVATCIYRALCRLCTDISESGGAHQNGLSTSETTSGSGSGNDTKSWSWTLFSAISTWIPGDPPTLTNRAAALPYTCTREEVGGPDPLGALAEVRESMEGEGSDKMDFAWSWKVFGDLFMNAGPIVAYDAVSRWTTPLHNVTCAFSNLRGPDEKLKCFSGKDLVNVAGYISTWEEADVGILTTSYNGHLSISVVARKKSFQGRHETQKFVDYIIEEAENLYAASTKKVS